MQRLVRQPCRWPSVSAPSAPSHTPSRIWPAGFALTQTRCAAPCRFVSVWPGGGGGVERAARRLVNKLGGRKGYPRIAYHHVQISAHSEVNGELFFALGAVKYVRVLVRSLAPPPPRFQCFTSSSHGGKRIRRLGAMIPT